MADKKEFRTFLLPEYEEEEQYLMDMAKQGYLFEKVTLPGIYHFKKCEPVDMVYRIDFNPQKKEERESYLQMFRDYGWEYLQDLNEFSYFCKPDDGSSEEIFSDNASRIEMMERIQRKKMQPILAIALCCLFPQVISLTQHNWQANAVSMGLTGLFSVIVILYVYLIARCSAGFGKLKKKYDVK